MPHRLIWKMAVAVIALSPIGEVASAQTVTCRPTEFRTSLVRIERPPRAPGTGVVIVKREKYVVILTVKHVVAFNLDEEFSLYFQVTPERRLPLRWTNTIVAASTDNELIAFRVDADIPKEVTPEDPFTDEIRNGSTLVSWGYPVASGGTLCSYQGRLLTPLGGNLVVDTFVPEGVSGGPTFYIDSNSEPRLAGIVRGGDGNATKGTTRAIDIRQAVTLMSSSRDPRNGGKRIVWPNIPPPKDFSATLGGSFEKIDAGRFTMGSDDGPKDQRPAQSRTLPVFYMGKYEVTVGQYRKCLDGRACTHRSPNANPSQSDLPVVDVTWEEADTYRKWLQGQLLARRDTPPDLRRLLEAGWQVDLPSEEEWERAARKDGTGTYSWGDEVIPRNANYNTGKPRAVTSSRCDGCGFDLFDLAGNAREWTRSLKLPYPYDPVKAEDPSAPGTRAIRGGSFKIEQQAPAARQIIRAANRQELVPSKSDEFTGFRLVLICKKERKCTWEDPN